MWLYTTGDEVINGFITIIRLWLWVPLFISGKRLQNACIQVTDLSTEARELTATDSLHNGVITGSE